MKYRHELKHEISASDMITIRQRLRAIAKSDDHAIDGKYLIRSLYFDTPEDKALVEKMNGVSRRHKFRIRYYNGDKSVIFLEKKIKMGGLGTKLSTRITEEEARSILNGDIDWMENSERELIKELYYRMVTERLGPKTIVDYTREPYIYAPGNVRVTMDYNIRTGLNETDFLNTECIMVPAAFGACVLEVKWDEFLPEIISDLVQLRGTRTGSFSKYEACRMPRVY